MFEVNNNLTALNFTSIKLAPLVENTSLSNTNYISCKDDGALDLFGPLCVVSCLVESQDVEWLNVLGIDNNGNYDETKVIEIGKELKDKLIYSLLILDNTHYNGMAKDGDNLACIRAKLYNQAITNVVQKVPNTQHTKICQAFVSPKTYFNYLKNEVIVVKDLEFIDKEEKRLSITCADILSRYACLQYFANMSKSLQIPIPRGTGVSVEQTAIKLIEKYNKDILSKVAKTNLPTYKKIIEKL